MAIRIVRSLVFVSLPLEEGSNELWLAVTEDADMRGGWGVLAAFEDVEGPRFE